MDESGSGGVETELSSADVGGIHQLATTLEDGLRTTQEKLTQKAVPYF